MLAMSIGPRDYTEFRHGPCCSHGSLYCCKALHEPDYKRPGLPSRTYTKLTSRSGIQGSLGVESRISGAYLSPFHPVAECRQKLGML